MSKGNARPDPATPSDGDALFARALLTVARSETPRDGGAAIGVFADWLDEQLGGRKWAGVCDPECTGFALVAVHTGAGERPYRVAVLMTDDPYARNDGDFPDFGEDFRDWFAEVAYAFWGDRR